MINSMTSNAHSSPDTAGRDHHCRRNRNRYLLELLEPGRTSGTFSKDRSRLADRLDLSDLKIHNPGCRIRR